jgi:hypothetical protein
MTQVTGVAKISSQNPNREIRAAEKVCHWLE